MKKGKKLVAILDWDNVLAPCTELACRKSTARGYPVDVSEVTMYSLKNLPEDVSKMLMAIFDEPDFFDDQAPYPGAVEMVDELLDAGHDVIIASAMKPELMGVRSRQIAAFLPRLDPKNIMLGSRKDLLHGDLLLDDALYNIETSPARYPVVFNQPWNGSSDGYIRVSGYKEFISMVEAISLAPDIEAPKVGRPGHPGLICLVGPSASGKSFICDELVKNPIFRKVRALTTRAPRPDGADASEYKFVSEAAFDQAVADGDMVEHTVYAGHRYGIDKREIEEIWNYGRVAIKPVDIHGAIACKAAYGDQCITVFIRRNKEAIIESLLQRDVPRKDTVRRLMSLDSELGNEQLCDWTVFNNGTLEHAVQQILRIIG